MYANPVCLGEVWTCFALANPVWTANVSFMDSCLSFRIDKNNESLSKKVFMIPCMDNSVF